MLRTIILQRVARAVGKRESGKLEQGWLEIAHSLLNMTENQSVETAVEFAWWVVEEVPKALDRIQAEGPDGNHEAKALAAYHLLGPSRWALEFGKARLTAEAFYARVRRLRIDQDRK